jgi:hypothetical protein
LSQKSRRQQELSVFGKADQGKQNSNMSWITSVFIALLTGGLGLFVAGCVAAACVNWYHISGFEGGSGYFMVAIALMGGIAGVFIGLMASWLVGAASAPGFFKGLGLSWGIVLSIAGAATLIAFLLADIPPRIKGRYLDLEVEIKLPVGETNSPANVTGNSSLTLGSVVNHVQRRSEKGDLKLGKARLENGRWIIPGSVSLFTMRGKRSIAAELGGKYVAGFIIPLPARPGKRFEQWSEWGPRPRPGNPPWPDTNPSYRFRVQRLAPSSPPPDPAVVEAERFAALKPDAPLESAS